MDKENTDFTKAPAFEAVTALVIKLLADSVPVRDIGFALSYVATELGMQLAPTTAHAIEVVMDGIRQSTALHARASSEAESADESEAEGDKTSSSISESYGTTIH